LLYGRCLACGQRPVELDDCHNAMWRFEAGSGSAPASLLPQVLHAQGRLLSSVPPAPKPSSSLTFTRAARSGTGVPAPPRLLAPQATLQLKANGERSLAKFQARSSRQPSGWSFCLACPPF